MNMFMYLSRHRARAAWKWRIGAETCRSDTIKNNIINCQSGVYLFVHCTL